MAKQTLPALPSRQHLNAHSVFSFGTSCGLRMWLPLCKCERCSVTAQSRVDYNTHAEFIKHGTLVFKEWYCCNKQAKKKVCLEEHVWLKTLLNLSAARTLMFWLGRLYLTWGFSWTQQKGSILAKAFSV